MEFRCLEDMVQSALFKRHLRLIGIPLPGRYGAKRITPKWPFIVEVFSFQIYICFTDPVSQICTDLTMWWFLLLLSWCSVASTFYLFSCGLSQSQKGETVKSETSRICFLASPFWKVVFIAQISCTEASRSMHAASFFRIIVLRKGFWTHVLCVQGSTTGLYSSSNLCGYAVFSFPSWQWRPRLEMLSFVARYPMYFLTLRSACLLFFCPDVQFWSVAMSG